jgi:RNA polymerase sigma factor (sigma-70 family)
VSVVSLSCVAVTDIETVESRIRPVVLRSSADIDEAFAAARPRLQRIATSLVGSAQAEDVVHDTYLMARARAGQLRDPLAAEAWLARICIHRSFRVNRRGRRFRELLDRLPGRERPGPRAFGLELRELIDGLSERERAVVILQHGYGYSLLEVAELVGVSHANARKIASRARARLLRAWQEAEQ